MEHSTDALIEALKRIDNPTVMGLDPRLDCIPESILAGKSRSEAVYTIMTGLIDCAQGLVAAVKPQSAYFEYSSEGVATLERVIKYAKDAGMYVIFDGKRNDIGPTAESYAEDYLSPDTGIDAITVNPYLGSDGIKPFMNAALKYDKMIFTLVRTSNPSAIELQDLEIDGIPLYKRTAALAAGWGEGTEGEFGFNRCGAVVGATYPKQLVELRHELPHTFFLIPGYGAQGGGAKDVAPAFVNGIGAVVNSSRAIMCAYKKRGGGDELNYQKYAREEIIAMRDDINSVIK